VRGKKGDLGKEERLRKCSSRGKTGTRKKNGLKAKKKSKLFGEGLQMKRKKENVVKIGWKEKCKTLG